MNHSDKNRLPVVLALLLALLTPSLPAQQTFSGQSEVVVVEVPVHVIEDGKPVRGLTVSDFELYDGKKKMKIIDFEVVDLSLEEPTGVPGLPLPTSARRHFLMLFDLAYAQPKSIVKARQAAVDLVRNSLHPSDLVAVATYSHNQGSRLVLTFTSDRDQIEAAVATLGVRELSGLQADPLGVALVTVDNHLATRQNDSLYTDGGQSFVGLTQQVKDQLLQDYLQTRVYDRQRIDREFESSRITAMSRSLADLGGLLAAVDGRKHVVFLSEGFDSSLVIGESNSLEENQNISTGQYWEVQTDQMFGDARLKGDLEEMMASFRRSDAMIHTVNIAGATNAASTEQVLATSLITDGPGDLAAVGGSGRNSLLTIADGTGGGFYDSYNDLHAAMRKLFDKTGVTYVLSFQPKDLTFDGRYHRVEVKLKNPRRGVRVEHRPGYYAPRPAYQHSAFERRLDTAELILSNEDQGALEAQVLALPLTVSGAPAYVPVVIEIDGESLLANDQGGRVLQVEIFSYVTDAEGRFLDYFTQFLELELARVRPMLMATRGLKFIGHLDLPPGDHTLRILVRNSASGNFALRVRPLTVPAADEPMLAPPMIVEPGDRWLVIGEDVNQAAERDVEYPFVHLAETGEDPTPARFAPSARPRVAFGEPADLYLLGRGLDGAEIGARIRGDDGRVAAAELEILDRAEHAFGELLRARLTPGPLRPGDYVLEITATGIGGGREAASALPFTVARP